MAVIIADQMTKKCRNVNTIWNSNLFIALLVQFEGTKVQCFSEWNFDIATSIPKINSDVKGLPPKLSDSWIESKCKPASYGRNCCRSNDWKMSECEYHMELKLIYCFIGTIRKQKTDENRGIQRYFESWRERGILKAQGHYSLYLLSILYHHR